jgi:hypothetical protein
MSGSLAVEPFYKGKQVTYFLPMQLRGPILKAWTASSLFALAAEFSDPMNRSG